LQGQFTSATCSITQRAAIAALLGDHNPTLEMVSKFKERRKRVMELLTEIPKITFAEPPGAFYVFPNVRAYFGSTTPAGELINNADDLSMYLLNTAHVSVVTGKAFGNADCIRMSFATNTKNIEIGYAKIKNALAALS
jgi:aspartate aminotransferase